jgi:hypothetical protein
MNTLPVTQGHAGTSMRQPVHARCGTGIPVGVLHTVARRTRSITKTMEVGFAGGLPRSESGIAAVEVRVAGPGVGAGLHAGTLAIIRSSKMRSGIRHLPVVPNLQRSPWPGSASRRVLPYAGNRAGTPTYE